MAHLGEVSEHQSEIERAGAHILAVSFAPAAMVAAYRADHSIAFDIASDVPREAYRAYGLGRGARTSIYRPTAVAQHLALRVRGYRPGPHAQDDVAQLGGDFVIGRDGHIRLSHPSVAGDDRASVRELLAAL
jgi:peroxiredoxin